MTSCAAVNTPKSTWSFCPNIGAAYLFAVLFALTTTAHLAQAIIHRKPYCWVIICSGLAQTICYISRVINIKNPASISALETWFILILCAPLLTNAFVYMVMGRMVYNFTTRAEILRVKAWRFTLCFVLLDIIAFATQIFGGLMASGRNVPAARIRKGLHIYQGGIALQQVFIFVFLALSVQFQRTLAKETPSNKTTQAMRLLYTMYAVLALITLRIIFRIAEYSKGLDSSIPSHEAYQYCLDSLPMLIAIILFNIVHPGKIMPGKESDFPSRKERKQASIGMMRLTV